MALQDHPKFAPFDVVQTEYKRVKDTPIPASILIPKNLKSGQHPLVVHWHGGGLVLGHRLFPDWYGKWFLDLSLKHGAITITPDHRLLPEANGQDILDDLRDFWLWALTPGTIDAFLPPGGHHVHLDHILVGGESAGGWCALESSLLLAKGDHNPISALAIQYPMVDLRAPHFSEDYPKDIFDPPIPQIDRTVLREHLAAIRAQNIPPIVTSAPPPQRFALVASIFQQGALPAILGMDRCLYPLEALEDLFDGKTTDTRKFPPVWVMHGSEDNVVPIEGTYKLVEKLEEGGIDVHASIRPGGHGFDVHEPEAKLEDDWMVAGVRFMEESWLKK